MLKRYFIIVLSLITIIAYFDLIDTLNHINKIIIGVTNLAD